MDPQTLNLFVSSYDVIVSPSPVDYDGKHLAEVLPKLGEQSWRILYESPLFFTQVRASGQRLSQSHIVLIREPGMHYLHQTVICRRGYRESFTLDNGPDEEEEVALEAFMLEKAFENWRVASQFPLRIEGGIVQRMQLRLQREIEL